MFSNVIQKQKAYFMQGQTRNVQFRKKQLRKLFSMVEQQEKEFIHALYQDLGKSEYEAYVTEIAMIYEEIKYALKHINQWAKPKKVQSSIATIPGKSRILYEPFGTVLIVSPWNYPVQLTLVPLVSAIAAGNTAVIKVSSTSSRVATLLKKVVNETFPEEYIYITEASQDEEGMLISQSFDYIFFTGSSTVGKLVMTEAAKRLIPVTLELGGKSPCIVDETANLKVAAKRILFGKVLNSGQTCVAPDYLLVSRSVKDALIEELKARLLEFYPDGIKSNTHPKIITSYHLERLAELLQGQTVIRGGSFDTQTQKMDLAFVDEPSLDSAVMKEEIFGPILPIFAFDTLDQAINIIHRYEKPLALYYFSKDKKRIQTVLSNVRFGGGAINDTILHLSNLHMPFGGVGQSGMGSYHGQYGFESFSHRKSMLFNQNLIDLSLKYPPFEKRNFKIIKRLMK
jgi:aldehyde dehydrogenase (NAD+)